MLQAQSESDSDSDSDFGLFLEPFGRPRGFDGGVSSSESEECEESEQSESLSTSPSRAISPLKSHNSSACLRVIGLLMLSARVSNLVNAVFNAGFVNLPGREAREWKFSPIIREVESI